MLGTGGSRRRGPEIISLFSETSFGKQTNRNVFQITSKWVPLRGVHTMAPTIHSPSAPPRPDPDGGSAAGHVALMVLLAAGLVAVSYPWLTLAAVAGAVGGHLGRCGVRALRCRRPWPADAEATSGRSDDWTPSPPK